MSSVDFKLKNILLTFENWPVALVGDGFGVNKSTDDSLATNYGLLSPTTGCSEHTAIGSIKRMASSKTMCAEEVVIFASGIHPILRHFQLSGKSTSLLNDLLEMMNMKEVKMMTWCPTQMANLLDTSARTVCDVLASCDVKGYLCYKTIFCNKVALDV